MKALLGLLSAFCVAGLLACSSTPQRVPPGLPPPEYEAPRVGTAAGAGGTGNGTGNVGDASRAGAEVGSTPESKSVGTE